MTVIPHRALFPTSPKFLNGIYITFSYFFDVSPLVMSEMHRNLKQIAATIFLNERKQKKQSFKSYMRK